MKTNLLYFLVTFALVWLAYRTGVFPTVEPAAAVPSACLEGIVTNRTASDRVLYADGGMSDNFVDNAPSYYLFILGSDGLTRYRRVSYETASMSEPGTLVSCKTLSEARPSGTPTTL